MTEPQTLQQPKGQGTSGTSEQAARGSRSEQISSGDALFLDGCVIETTWKGGRELIGTIQFRAEASKPRVGKQPGRTKYRIFFQGRKPSGVRVSWNRLKTHPFKVVASNASPRFARPFLPAECKALQRRLQAGESLESLTCSFGRTFRSLEHFKSDYENRPALQKARAKKAGKAAAKAAEQEARAAAKLAEKEARVAAKLARQAERAAAKLARQAERAAGKAREGACRASRKTASTRRTIVRDALRRVANPMPGQGTLSDICAEVYRVHRNQFSERQRAVATGQRIPQWYYEVTICLKDNKTFRKTDLQVPSLGNGRMGFVYELVEDVSNHGHQEPGEEPTDEGARDASSMLARLDELRERRALDAEQRANGMSGLSEPERRQLETSINRLASRFEARWGGNVHGMA